MKYNRFGRTGLQVSEIGYGGIVSTMGDYGEYHFAGDAQEASDSYVEYALGHGVNYFDVAPAYGDAQEKLGNSLKGKRKEIILACKTLKRSYDEAAREFERSLNLLHTDYFDIYQLHSIMTEDDVEEAFAKDGVMKLLFSMKEQGVIKNIGITGHGEAACLMALDRYDYDSILFPINWQMNMGFGYGSKVIEKAKERDMGLICMKSMIERAFLEQDEAARQKYPKSWCKPFDTEQQAELLLAAMKYSVSLGIDILLPAGDIDHFRFAIEHEEEIKTNPFNEEDRRLLENHLQKVISYPFMEA